MRVVRRQTLNDMAPAIMEIVADLMGDTRPDELQGYIVIGLRKDGGFGVASNARDDDAEVAMLRDILHEHGDGA